MSRHIIIMNYDIITRRIIITIQCYIRKLYRKIMSTSGFHIKISKKSPKKKSM